MNERPTPETDAECGPNDPTGWPSAYVPTDFARRLERERDEAREQAEKMREAFHRCKQVAATTSECWRDESAKMLEAIKEMLFDVARVEWKYGRNNDGSPKDWTEWNNVREHLKKFDALRKPEELQPFLDHA